MGYFYGSFVLNFYTCYLSEFTFDSKSCSMFSTLNSKIMFIQNISGLCEILWYLLVSGIPFTHKGCLYNCNIFFPLLQMHSFCFQQFSCIKHKLKTNIAFFLKVILRKKSILKFARTQYLHLMQ